MKYCKPPISQMSATCSEADHCKIYTWSPEISAGAAELLITDCADAALSSRGRRPGNEVRRNSVSALQAWCWSCCCSFISLFHTFGPVFEPLQMLVGARKSMHSDGDRRDLVLDNSGCLSVHYSLVRHSHNRSLCRGWAGDKEWSRLSRTLRFSVFRFLLLAAVSGHSSAASETNLFEMETRTRPPLY